MSKFINFLKSLFSSAKVKLAAEYEKDKDAVLLVFHKAIADLQAIQQKLIADIDKHQANIETAQQKIDEAKVEQANLAQAAAASKATVEKIKAITG